MIKKTLFILSFAALTLAGALPQQALAAEAPLPLRTTATATPGEPVNLAIQPPAGVAQSYRFVMVRGLPDTATFTAGFRVRQSWLIAAKDLPQAHLLPDAETDGGFVLEFTFFEESGKPPAGRSLVHVRMAAGEGTTAADRAGQTLSSSPPTKLDEADAAATLRRELAVFTSAQEAELLKKGEDYMRLGDVATARLLFEDLAAHGCGDGALAMGKSYDPGVLKGMFVAGNLQPSREKAKLWYQRARDMGIPDAQVD